MEQRIHPDNLIQNHFKENTMKYVDTMKYEKTTANEHKSIAITSLSVLKKEYLILKKLADHGSIPAKDAIKEINQILEFIVEPSFEMVINFDRIEF